MRRSKNRPAFPYWYKQYCQTGNSYWLKLFNRNGKRCNKKHKGQCNSLWESVQRGEEPLKVFVIAEAGINHNGELKLAKKLVDAAKDAGADCIKFQTFISKNLTTKNASKAEYQKQTKSEESQYDMLKRYELSFDEFSELSRYCQDKNIEFLSTAFDLKHRVFKKS